MAAVSIDNCFKMSVTYDVLHYTTHSLIYGGIYYLAKPHHTETEKEKHQHLQMKSKKNHYKLTIFEYLLAFTLATLLLINIAVRLVKGVPSWLFQPCHVLTAILLYVILNPQSNSKGFYLFFYSLWMPLYGLAAAPHPSWFQWWFELPVFYIHHYVIVLLPYYYLFVNHRFHPHFTSSSAMVSRGTQSVIQRFTHFTGRFRHYLTVQCIALVYHSGFLGFLGLYLNEDFDSMRCRFAGGEMFGIWWREALILAGVLIVGMTLSVIPEFIAHFIFHKPPTKSTNKTNVNNDDHDEHIISRSSINKNKLS